MGKESLTQRFVDKLAAQPLTFDALRWVLEAGYRGEKEVLRREGLLDAPSVLDLGCGTGAMAPSFDPRRYLGVDINRRYVDWARRTKPAHRFEAMDGSRLNLPDEGFDAVFIGGVIHHLPDEAALGMLREARRVVKPAGLFLMWEDVPTRSGGNWIGRMVHRLDEGEHIRAERHYLDLVSLVFGPTRHYAMSSGVCDYLVVVWRGGGNHAHVF